MFDFYGKRKIFLTISLSIMLIGVVFNVLFGTKLDISFKGGSEIVYSYTGDVDFAALVADIKETAGVNVSINENTAFMKTASSEKNMTIAVAGKNTLSNESSAQIKKLFAENDTYKDHNFVQMDFRSRSSNLGKAFAAKAGWSLGLAGLLMAVYVAFRFRKVGGWSAGLFSLLALLHDVIIIYFTFVIFRIPLNDNFIAVELAILGYSLNDTIVIFDRIRENRRLLGSKIAYSELVNTSLNQSFIRTLNTSITTLLAILTVGMVALFAGLTSIISFAFPMSVGVIVGCYSSIAIASPFWVTWKNRSLKKAAEKQDALKEKAKADREKARTKAKEKAAKAKAKQKAKKSK